MERDFHAMGITFFTISANSAIIHEITFLHLIALLTENSKSMLSPFTRKFFSSKWLFVGLNSRELMAAELLQQPKKKKQVTNKYNDDTR